MSCVAPGCKVGYGTSKLPPGVTRHVFPKDPARLEAWIKAVPRDNWKPAANSVICSLHFESSDFKTFRCNGEVATRRRLNLNAVPSKFAVKDYERCCIPCCNNISNTFAFPRLKKKDWTQILAKYFKDPEWEPQSWTRICSDHFRAKDITIYGSNRQMRLEPRANPFIDAKKYPLVKREPVKPALLPKPKDPPPPVEPTITNPAKTVIVRHDLSNARTFYLERVIKVEPPPPGPMSAMDIVKYDHPYQQQQFQLQKEQQDIEVQQKMAEPQIRHPNELQLRQLKPGTVDGPSSKGRFPHTMLMRARGNPNIFVQVDAQLWTPTAGKFPTLPPPKPVRDPAEVLARKQLGTVKDRKIRKLNTKVHRLQKRNEELQTRLDDLTKAISNFFEPDQIRFLSCKGDIKTTKNWSEKTFAKAFDLRLNCGNQTYNYLLDKGFPLPSFKSMRRYIGIVENEIKAAEKDQAVHAEAVLQPEVIYQTLDEHHYVIEAAHQGPKTVTHIGQRHPASGVFEVQQSLPMVMTSDLTYATTNHDLESSGHVIDASEIQFQTEDGQMVDPRQQLYVIQQGNQVAVLQGGEYRLQNGQILRESTNQLPIQNQAKRKQVNQADPMTPKRRRTTEKEPEGPIWYLKLSDAVRQRILFPAVPENLPDRMEPSGIPDLETDEEETESETETQEAVNSIVAT